MSARTETNGRALAAILAACVGVLLLGLMAFLADWSQGIKKFLSFYAPAHDLSGSTTLAAGGWLTSWIILHLAWRRKDLPFNTVCLLSWICLGLGLLLMCLPLAMFIKR